jgi:hypothetical protein
LPSRRRRPHTPPRFPTTGKVWKTLPQAEREQWEKRAVQAQAEHRARYPDWRFRPGTNVDAIAKRKTKDKNKDRPPERRRRNATARDKALAAAARGPAGDGGGGGGGARCKKARGVMQERRCAQIAELLARGVKGVALTSAVQAWDKESGVSNVTDGVFVTEQGVDGGDSGADADSDRVAASNSNKSSRGRKTTMTTSKATIKARSASSAQKARFTSSDVPLTAMYRRATSAPLAPEHGTITPASAASSPSTSAFSPVPDFCPPPLSPASSVSYGSEVSFPDSDNMSVSAFALRPPFFIDLSFLYFILFKFSPQVLPMFDFVPFSPPGSPCSSNMDNNDIAALGSGSVRSPTLGIAPANAAAPEADAASLQHFFSNYSTLCDWAGGGVGTANMVTTGAGMPDGGSAANTKVVLPPLPLQYGAFGEIDHHHHHHHHHPFSFMHTAETATAVAVNPWNNEQDLVARPLFGGLDDTWVVGARAAAAVPYAC